MSHWIQLSNGLWLNLDNIVYAHKYNNSIVLYTTNSRSMEYKDKDMECILAAFDEAVTNKVPGSDDKYLTPF